MRIVYLHQYFNTHAMVGGTRSYEMARRLVAWGHEVHMITSRRDPPTGAPRDWYRTVEDGIHVHWLPVPYANSMSYRERLNAFFRFAWSAGGRAASLLGDVIFATSTPLTIALPAVWAAWSNRISMVLEIRDLWPDVPIAMGALRSRPAVAAAHWLERFAYRNAVHIVALSPDIKTGIARAGYAPERITVLPNACDVELFDVAPASGRALRQRHAWLGDRPLVIYTGTLGPLNGVGYLARVAAAAAVLDPEVCFLVIGDGKDEPLIRRTATELHVLDRNFFMLPSRPKAEMPAWMSAADIATSVVVDRRELWANSANKVFDAFAAATPVAINHEGWLAELLRDTGAGLVLDPRNAGAAAAALVRAVRDSGWRARAAAAGRELARDRFNRDRLAEQLERLLQRAARAPAAEREIAGVAAQ